jgi:hypothetical protein
MLPGSEDQQEEEHQRHVRSKVMGRGGGVFADSAPVEICAPGSGFLYIDIFPSPGFISIFTGTRYGTYLKLYR